MGEKLQRGMAKELVQEVGFERLRDAIRAGAEVKVRVDGELWDRKATGEALVSYLGHEYNDPAPKDRIEGIDPKYRIEIVIRPTKDVRGNQCSHAREAVLEVCGMCDVSHALRLMAASIRLLERDLGKE